MAKQLMAQVRSKAIRSFIAGKNTFNLFGRVFNIVNVHSDNYAVNCSAGELFRIVGDAKHFRIV